MRVAYSLTADADTLHFVEMTRLSALSVSLRVPGAEIVVYVDVETEARLRHRLDAVFDGLAAVRVIDTGGGSAAYRNRFIRTSLRNLLDGPFLYLDGDTLVRTDIRDAFANDGDIALVINHNDPDMTTPANEAALMRRCGWAEPEGPYYNAGVQFWSDTATARKAGARYHAAWRELTARTGLANDQQAFNHAVAAEGLAVRLLPSAYNAQLDCRMGPAFEARVWHFFYAHHGAMPIPRTRWQTALDSQLTPAALEMLLDQPHPWVVDDPVSSAILRQAQRDFGFLGHRSWRRYWLAGQRRRAAMIALREGLLFAPRLARRMLRQSPGARQAYRFIKQLAT
jgi:hypothetical protein